MKVSTHSCYGVELNQNEAAEILRDKDAVINKDVKEVLNGKFSFGQIVPAFTFMVVSKALEICTHDAVILNKSEHHVSILTLKPMVFHWTMGKVDEYGCCEDEFVGYSIADVPIKTANKVSAVSHKGVYRIKG